MSIKSSDFGLTSFRPVARKPQNWRGTEKPKYGCIYFINKSTGNMSERQAQRPRKRSALVLYGSETGNAQEVAEELGTLAERLHFITQVSELNHVKPVCLLPLCDH
jgi:sulfite reductase alpha subunit-like flavoprotein